MTSIIILLGFDQNVVCCDMLRYTRWPF